MSSFEEHYGKLLTVLLTTEALDYV